MQRKVKKLTWEMEYNVALLRQIYAQRGGQDAPYLRHFILKLEDNIKKLYHILDTPYVPLETQLKYFLKCLYASSSQVEGLEQYPEYAAITTVDRETATKIERILKIRKRKIVKKVKPSRQMVKYYG